jgi:hypothetical protein
MLDEDAREAIEMNSNAKFLGTELDSPTKLGKDNKDMELVTPANKKENITLPET